MNLLQNYCIDYNLKLIKGMMYYQNEMDTIIFISIIKLKLLLLSQTHLLDIIILCYIVNNSVHITNL